MLLVRRFFSIDIDLDPTERRDVRYDERTDFRLHRLARDAHARVVGPGPRSSDRRAHLEPGREARAAHSVSFAGRELGIQRNRVFIVQILVLTLPM